MGNRKEVIFTVYKKLHILSILIGVMSIVFPIVFWEKIPEQIPMHYNAAGMIDNWGDKTTLVLLFFVVVLMMGMMSIVIYIIRSNQNSKYSTANEKSIMHVVYQMMVIMNLMIQIMFAYIIFCCVTSRPLGVLFLPVFLAGVFLPMGYMIIKIRKFRKKSETEKVLFRELEREEAGTVYSSAVDWWLGLILGGTELMMLWFSIEPIISTGKISWGMMLTTIGVTIMLLPLFSIKYVMYSKHVKISMGFYGTIRFRYADIVAVKKTNNPLSSAALSLKRIQIDYMENRTHQMVLISPKDRDSFISELEMRRT